ncbi:MAG: hypothetical protein ABEJ05_02475 [Haloglomus sp.]
MVTGDETFRKAVVIITVGMVVPALPIALAGDLIVASLSYRAFLGTLAVGYGAAVVVLLEWLSLDRPTFTFASLVWPWVVFLAALLVVLLLNDGEQIPRGPIADVVRTLYGNAWIWGQEGVVPFEYGAAFTIAGVGAVALSSRLQRGGLRPAEQFE